MALRFRFIFIFLVFCFHLSAQKPLDLFLAIRSGDLRGVKSIIQRDTSLAQQPDINDASPIQWACFYGKMDIVRYLADTVQVSLQAKGFVRVDTTLDKDVADVFKLVYKSVPVPTFPAGATQTLKDKTNLIYCGNLVSIATARSNIPLLRYLVEEKHLSPNARDYDKQKGTWTRGITPFEWACFKGDTEAMIYLQNMGADINADNGLAVILSIFNQNEFILPYLISKGVPGKAFFMGNNALHWAAKLGNAPATQILLEYGMDPNVSNTDGLYPIALSLSAQCEMLPSLSRQLNAQEITASELMSAAEQVRFSLMMHGGKLAPDGQEEYVKDRFSLNNPCTDRATQKFFDPLERRNLQWMLALDEFDQALQSLEQVNMDKNAAKILKLIDRRKPGELAGAYVVKWQADFSAGRDAEAKNWIDSISILMPVLTDKKNGGFVCSANANIFGMMLYLQGDAEKARQWYEFIIALDDISSKPLLKDPPLIFTVPSMLILGISKSTAYRMLAAISMKENNIKESTKFLFSLDKFAPEETSFLFLNQVSYLYQNKLLTLADLTAIANNSKKYDISRLTKMNGVIFTGSKMITPDSRINLDVSSFFNFALCFTDGLVNREAFEIAMSRQSASLEISRSWNLKQQQERYRIAYNKQWLGRYVHANLSRIKYKRSSYVYDYALNQTVFSLEALQDSTYWNVVKQRSFMRYEKVKQTLAPDEALIDYIVYTKPFSDSTYYGAFLIRPNDSVPLIFELCKRPQLDILIFDTQTEQAGTYRGDPLTTASSEQSLNKDLFSLIFQPFLPFLKDVKNVIIIPAGATSFVNFLALRTKEGNRLMDLYDNISFRSSVHEVRAGWANEPGKIPQSIALFGAVRYDKEPDTRLTPCRLPASTITTLEILDKLKPIEAPRLTAGQQKKFLTGTDAEVRSIAAYSCKNKLKTALYRAEIASEDNFRQIFGIYCTEQIKPDVIVFSTHGFSTTVSKVKTIGNYPDEMEEEYIIKDPMNECGLLLAGADRTLQGLPMDGREDGILKANEIAQLDLRGVKLVVLSACETGLGAPIGNEGSFGLVRAFKMAGAEKVMVSLWSVDDQATSMFMRLFFEAYLEHNQSPRQALKQAQSIMQKSPQYADPKFWAPFILVE